MVTYCRSHGGGPGVQGVGRPDPTSSAGPTLRARRPHAHRAGVRAGDDALRCHEAPEGARGGRARRRCEEGPGKAALPEPGPDPADPRPLDRQVHRAPGHGARRPQERTGAESMTTMTQAPTTTQVHRIYIKAKAQAIWDALTQPEWSARFGYGGFVHSDLRVGGRYYANASEEMRAASRAMGNELPDVIIDGEV